MKKFIILSLLAIFLFFAYASKPDDKTCIISAVTSVWGNLTPTPKKPMYYDQFMNITSKFVVIHDWIFFKQIEYKFKEGVYTVGIGAFKKVYTFNRLSKQPAA